MAGSKCYLGCLDESEPRSIVSSFCLDQVCSSKSPPDLCSKCRPVLLTEMPTCDNCDNKRCPRLCYTFVKTCMEVCGAPIDCGPKACYPKDLLKCWEGSPSICVRDTTESFKPNDRTTRASIPPVPSVPPLPPTRPTRPLPPVPPVPPSPLIPTFSTLEPEVFTSTTTTTTARPTRPMTTTKHPNIPKPSPPSTVSVSYAWIYAIIVGSTGIVLILLLIVLIYKSKKRLYTVPSAIGLRNKVDVENPPSKRSRRKHGRSSKKFKM